jgi:hypothetical protein
LTFSPISTQVASTLRDAAARFGFAALGINGLPPLGREANPVILAEATPSGFRDEHTQNAARKLGAVTRTHAVVIALREKIITFGQPCVYS